MSGDMQVLIYVGQMMKAVIGVALLEATILHLKIKCERSRAGNWWTFPDISKGGVQTVGWLGQVHRGRHGKRLYEIQRTGKKQLVRFR